MGQVLNLPCISSTLCSRALRKPELHEACPCGQFPATKTNFSSRLPRVRYRPTLNPRCSSHPELESNRHPQREQTMWTKQQAQTESPSAPAQAAKPAVVAV